MTTLTSLFTNAFAAFEDKTCISFYRGKTEETRLSYGEIGRDTGKMANLFLEYGIRKGDRVVLMSDKSVAFMMAHLAVQMIGGITVSLNPGFKKSELRYLLDDAEPKLIIANPDNGPLAAELRPDAQVLAIDPGLPYRDLAFFRGCSEDLPDMSVRPDDPSVIIYTSGTTGDPKGAVLTHRNMAHNCRRIIDAWEIVSSDVLCHCLPLFHTHGLCFAAHTLLAAGGRLKLLDKFSPDTVMDSLATADPGEAATIFMAVPAMYKKIIAALGSRQPRFDHVRLWTCGSAPLLPKDFFAIKAAFGKEPVEREGMTETGMNFTNPLHGEKKPGSIGMAFPDLEVRIVDPDTRLDVAPGQVGELWLKSPSIFVRYWKKPEKTAESFDNGWFRTGDLGKADQDGYHYITDRIKNIIISGGENISPNEIERVINSLDEVAESCVVGIPDPQWGEKVVAFAVTRPGAGDISQEIRTVCKANLLDWKCPKDIVFIEKLPKNTMGKVLQDELRRSYTN